MKFPSTTGDIVTVHVNQKVVCECYVATLKVEPTNDCTYHPHAIDLVRDEDDRLRIVPAEKQRIIWSRL